MTSLQDRVGQDWKDAMKARDPKKDVLSLIKTELKNKAINGREAGGGGTLVDDASAMEVLNKMAKQRRESMESFKAGGREDLVEKEQYELSVIEAYLPKQMTDAEIEGLVKVVIAEVGASSIKDMGKVMSVTIAKAEGRAHGSRVQVAVKQLLGA